MNEPSAQFLSESESLHPSFNENDLRDSPPELFPVALAWTFEVPSIFWQYTRRLIFLNSLTFVDCELALDCWPDAELPPGPLCWLELEFWELED